MKNLLALLLVATIAFTSCDNKEDLFIPPPCDQVSYTFTNELGVDIDGLVIESYDTMALADGATSITYCIDGIYGFLPNDPWINFELEINGQNICSIAMLNWCGTGATSDDSGMYEITLTGLFVSDAFPTTCSEYATYASIKL